MKPRRNPRPRDPEPAAPPRIIGGTLRGRRLEFLPDGPTRPMKDRVRESLFDLLGTDVPGSLALDLFAGTGALGFEAASRGAARVIFVERHFPTADTLRRSARALGLEGSVEVRAGDVLLWARRLPPLPTDLPWVAFVSPPWSFFAERRDELTALIGAIAAAAPARSRIVVESDTDFDPRLLPDPDAWTTRSVPPAALHFADCLASRA